MARGVDDRRCGRFELARNLAADAPARQFGRTACRRAWKNGRCTLMRRATPDLLYVAAYVCAAARVSYLGQRSRGRFARRRAWRPRYSAGIAYGVCTAAPTA